jgi:hypothetical protein
MWSALALRKREPPIASRVVSSARRSPVTLILLFVVPFVAAAMVAFLFRTNQLEASTPTELIQTSTETTIPAETIPPLSVETTEITVAPATTIVVTTTAPPAETTTLPPTTTEAPPPEVPDAPISTEGAVLAPVTDKRILEADKGCASLSRSNDSVVRGCETGGANGLDIAWVSADEGVDILTHSSENAADEWNVVLRSATPASRPPVFTDVTGDGEIDIVVGYRPESSLGVDVVEIRNGTAEVTLHLSLANGRAIVGDGRLQAWSELEGGAFARWTYSGGGDRWQGKSAIDNDPPSGQF